MDFAAGVCLSEAPSPLLKFLLGWTFNFIGSESGQIPGAEYGLQQNRIQPPPPPPPPHEWEVIRNS